MNFRPQFSLMLLLCVAFSARGMELVKREASVSKEAVSTQFSAIINGKVNPIQRCFVDKEIRDFSPVQLKRFVDNGSYLKLREFHSKDGIEYGLDAQGRLKGGGPFCAALTFIGGTATTIAAAAAVIVVTLPVNPIATAFAVVTTVKGGMVATAYATAVVLPLPTL